MIKQLLWSVLMLSLLAGCGTTSVKTDWKDPGYLGHGIGSVLVICVPTNLDNGNSCMDEFVSQFKKRGVSAVPAYSAMSVTAPKQEVIAKARELGLQMVLVSRFLDKKSELEIYPRQGPTMLMFPGWYDPGYELVPQEYEVIGTVLYEVASGKAIWSAVSDTLAGRSEKKVTKSYVEAMIDKLKHQGLLGGH
jgi:hypothetical protein